METNLTVESSVEQSSAVINQTIDSAVSANKRKLFVQHIIESTPMKLAATGLLLSSLFAATFLVAYQTTQKTKIKAAFNEVPQAEIILPSDISRTPKESMNQFCGGIAGLACSEGFMCKLDGDYPDASGACVPEEAKPIDTEIPVAP
jgi:hypothetical protein